MLFALHMSEAVRGIDKGAFFLNTVLLLYFKYCIKYTSRQNTFVLFSYN